MSPFFKKKIVFSSIFLFLFLFVLYQQFFLQGQEASAPLPQSIREARAALQWEGWFTIVMFILTFICLVIEFRPPDITMLACTGILVIVGVLTPNQFLEGFSNDIVMTIAMLCIIVRAMEVNGVLEIVAKRVLTSSKNFYLQMLSMCAPVSVASAFLNNTPIVLLMTPVVRKWAMKNKMSPSKFLLPLSYAALFGGACTLIGTSTNLVVYGLLRRHSPEAAFSFFELAYVGVPCAIAGLLYLIFFGPYLLPSRLDPTTALMEETREFTAEFIVGPDCPLANKTVAEGARRYFRKELLIQIERNHAFIDSPSPDLVIFIGDRLVFAGGINQIAELHAIKGLESQADPHFKLDVTSSHFSEIVIPSTSLLIGKTLRQINFRSNYGASVIAVYRQGWRVLGNIRDIILQAGDTLMLLSGEPWTSEIYSNKDFYYIRHHEKLHVLDIGRAIFIVVTLVAMIISATLGVPILIASLAAVFLLMVTRSISIKEAQNSIMWNVLLLIACSFALGRAMETTGVADYFAELLLSVVSSAPYMLIGGILLVTICCTELITNNAAALILFPIAINVAKLAGYDSLEAIKAIGITIAIGASCAYAVPTGYQTHMIVYGPGGYKFSDFMKVGIFMDLIIWSIATTLIPRFWPLSP
ncbi:MAG: SLC13 family permease [Waddliaceae bacterium]